MNERNIAALETVIANVSATAMPRIHLGGAGRQLAELLAGSGVLSPTSLSGAECRALLNKCGCWEGSTASDDEARGDVVPTLEGIARGE